MALALLLGVSACGTGEWPYAGAGRMVVTGVTLDKASYDIIEGQRLDAHATVRGAGGITLAGRTVQWGSSAPDVLQVDDTGRLTAVKGGHATLTVSCEGVSTSTAVVVWPVQWEARNLPSRLLMAPGATRQLQPQLVDGAGRALEVEVAWSAQDPNVVTVSPEGLVTARAEGSTRVLGLHSWGSLSVQVEVNPRVAVDIRLSPVTLGVGGTWAIPAEVHDSTGAPGTIETLQWESSDPQRLSIRDGFVTAVEPGRYTVTARTSAASGSAEVEVQAPRADSVSISPPATMLSVGDTRWVRAQALDAAGAPVFSPTVQWSSSDASVLTVSPEGRMQALTPGVVTLTATAAGRSGTAQVQVLGEASAFTRRLVVFSGDGRTTLPGSVVDNGPPKLLLVDAQGRAVSGVRLTLEVLTGGGTAQAYAADWDPTHPATDSSGFVSLKWRLGTTPGLNLLRVSAPQARPVTLVASAGTPASDFVFDFRYAQPVSPQVEAVFQQAAARFLEVIKRPLAAEAVQLAADACFVGSPAVSEEALHGVIVLVAFDGGGPVSTEGARVCATRAGGALPAVSVLHLSSSLRTDTTPERHRLAITHALAHALGLGTLWGRDGLLQGTDTGNPTFVGPAAVAAFLALGGDRYPGNPIPLDTHSVARGEWPHWRDAIRGDELLRHPSSSMDGAPLTRFTAGALQDLGYEADLQAGDAWRNSL